MTTTINDENHRLLTIKGLLALTIADIDIFLLMNKEQTDDNDKESFTRKEIRDQLGKTMIKISNVLISQGCDINEIIKIFVQKAP